MDSLHSNAIAPTATEPLDSCHLPKHSGGPQLGRGFFNCSRGLWLRLQFQLSNQSHRLLYYLSSPNSKVMAVERWMHLYFIFRLNNHVLMLQQCRNCGPRFRAPCQCHLSSRSGASNSDAIAQTATEPLDADAISPTIVEAPYSDAIFLIQALRWWQFEDYCINLLLPDWAHRAQQARKQSLEKLWIKKLTFLNTP